MVAQMGERANEFLEDIDRNPLDRGLWLIFSDWLEERGHPVAEGLRLLVELKRYPHCEDAESADDYWHWLLEAVDELGYGHCRLPCRNAADLGHKVFRTYDKFSLALLYGAIYLPNHFKKFPEDLERARISVKGVEPCHTKSPPNKPICLKS